MKRRSLLATIGLVAGGGAVFGTGAFSSVEAERTVSVEVASDSQAYLALDDREEGPNSGFANIAYGTIQFDIDDVFPPEDYEDKGQGPGSKSVYTFDNVFGVENQGTNDVYFEVEFEDIDTLDGIGFYAGDDDETLLDGEDNVAKIPVGAEADMGIFLDTSEEGVERSEDREIDNITAVITAAEDTDTSDLNVVEDISLDD